MLKSNITKTTNNLIVNSLIELGDDLAAETKGKGRKFVSKFIEPGVAHYDEFGDVLITKETLDKFINTMVGAPVIIKHKDITDKNADKERVGVISNVWFNEMDGWYYCDGIIWDKQAIDLVKNQGWSVSCTYDFESDKKPKTHNGKKIDMEFTDGEFLHLALVDNPRYERANIVMNSRDEKEEEQQDNIKDTVFDAIAEVVTNCLGECRNWSKENFDESKVKRDGGKFAKQNGSPKPKLRNYKTTLDKHKQLGLVEKFPPDFLGNTEKEIADFLGIKGNKPAIFKTPIETVKIYRSNFSHIDHKKDKTRILGLSRAIAALKNPNIIIQDGKENYYIKFFQKGNNDKIHMQVIRTKKQGGFYKTNFPISKNRYETMKGQIIYDLSSKRGI